MSIDMHPLDFLESIYADSVILEATEDLWHFYRRGMVSLGAAEDITEEPDDLLKCPYCEREEAMKAVLQLTWAGDDSAASQCDLACQHCPYTLTVYGLVRDPIPEGQARGELRLDPPVALGRRAGQG